MPQLEHEHPPLTNLLALATGSRVGPAQPGCKTQRQAEGQAPAESRTEPQTLPERALLAQEAWRVKSDPELLASMLG